jgi:predicted 3-demethylubiquinone-9 3-methyltransferase (glyoxalase superfamily)
MAVKNLSGKPVQKKITPFLWFDKKAEEAMNFYVSIFKNSRIVSISHYPDGPLEGPMKGMEGKVLGGVFELEGQAFMALDGGPLFKPTPAISFYVECETQKEVDHYWDRLAEGGDPKAQRCGWLQDKYGFSWQIIPAALPRLLSDPDGEKAGRAMQAMLKMKKIDIATLKRAHRGRK